jgi:hypothetical protein
MTPSQPRRSVTAMGPWPWCLHPNAALNEVLTEVVDLQLTPVADVNRRGVTRVDARSVLQRVIDPHPVARISI